MQLTDLGRFLISSAVSVCCALLPPPLNITYLLHYIDIAVGWWVGGGGGGRRDVDATSV